MGANGGIYVGDAMSYEIEIGEDEVEMLDKYCNEYVRPAHIGAMLGRIVEAWYARAAKLWSKSPELIPKLQKLNKTQMIEINSDDGRQYIRTISALEKKLDIQINPAELTSWLVRMFEKTYRLKNMSKYKIDMGRIKKS